MAEVAPGQANTYVPTFSEATGLVQVEYSRNPTSFAINQYTKLVPVTKDTGYYLRIDEEEQARVVTLADTMWSDGNDAPEGIQQDHEFTAFRTQRHAPTFQLGQKSAGNAELQQNLLQQVTGVLQQVQVQQSVAVKCQLRLQITTLSKSRLTVL